LAAQRSEDRLNLVFAARKSDHRLFWRPAQLDTGNPLLRGSTDEFSCRVKGPPEIVPDCARFYEFQDFLPGQEAVAMHRASESHISDPDERHVDLLRQLLHDPVQTMVTPLFALLCRIGKQWSRNQEALGTDLFRSLQSGVVRIAGSVPSNRSHQRKQAMLWSDEDV
jgi:hypothetical protein